MQRRRFITLVWGTIIALPLSARAQRAIMPVVAFLEGALLPEPDEAHRVTAFHQGMKETGYVDGQNVAIELPAPYGSAEGQTNRLQPLLSDLLRRQVAVIVGNTPTALAAKAATTTVPIVFVTGWDPVRDGLVASLNRPGGNLTGSINSRTGWRRSGSDCCTKWFPGPGSSRCSSTQAFWVPKISCARYRRRLPV